jgi:hypothetical protein
VGGGGTDLLDRADAVERLLLVPVFYSIAALDLNIVKWEPGKH